jgi:menaquinone-specific isochorismate synthase
MKEQNKKILAKQLVEKLKATNASDKRFYRIEVDADGLAPLDWLEVQKNQPKIYWADRDRNFEVAGVGAVQILSDKRGSDLAKALSMIEENLALADSDLRYYGGICFDTDSCPAESWKPFGRFYFVLPQFELRRDNERTTFAFNLEYKPDDSQEEIIEKLLGSFEELNFTNESPCQSLDAEVLSRVDRPDRSKWKENIAQVTETLRSEDIKKVVLSRRSTFQMSQTVDPIALLKQVSNNSVNTYNFCFQLDEANAFAGCSPECLYKKDHNTIYTEAIAGTCLTGKTKTQQQHFQKDMLSSDKEIEEHRYVFDDVNADLNKICSRVSVLDQRDIISLKYVQHFCSRFEGIEKENINTQKIIETLHPTAAVNGYPKHAAKDQIRKYESFSRGWYAGPVGWIGKDSAEFAVAIRSGLIQKKEISLFAGAGIVKSSDPASEWDELENKLKPFLKVIG